ncbi:MAG: 23S rRNA (adenine(2030)-N(6))-methyltransferase RlmJ [Hyphomicrobiales bacterium]|nr:23S rRNA (adenine(2030)-N(6))-methyltransferase RlmJ [Hyphomicrobiales bacterium]
MNYRHAFHAGNFADVFKHALLTRILVYLNRKETPYRVIDTHAGEGAYDLSRDEAARTGEWREGIGRLATIAPDGPVSDLLQPFLDIVGACDAEGRPLLYPGSPLIAQKLARRSDRLVFCEKHPDAFGALKRRFARDRRVRALDLDGWTALGAFVPPPERRGLVLVDPPFEQKDEFATLAKSFAAAFAKWPTGVYALWHPVKDLTDARRLWDAVRESGAKSALRLELAVAPASAAGLARTGLIVVNPPFVLEGEARALLPALAHALERAPGQGAILIERFGG